MIYLYLTIILCYDCGKPPGKRDAYAGFSRGDLSGRVPAHEFHESGAGAEHNAACGLAPHTLSGAGIRRGAVPAQRQAPAADRGGGDPAADAADDEARRAAPAKADAAGGHRHARLFLRRNALGRGVHAQRGARPVFAPAPGQPHPDAGGGYKGAAEQARFRGAGFCRGRGGFSEGGV